MQTTAAKGVIVRMLCRGCCVVAECVRVRVYDVWMFYDFCVMCMLDTSNEARDARFDVHDNPRARIVIRSS